MTTQITFKQFRQRLNEVRKNPSLNPKISAYDALLPYKDDSSIFITFADSKVGIKPMARYDTPLGVYCYELQKAWKYYDVKQKKSLSAFPYGLNYEDIFILRKKSNTKILNLTTLDQGEYTLLCIKLLSLLKSDSKFNNGNSHDAYNQLYRKMIQYGSTEELPDYGNHIDVDIIVFSKLTRGTIEYNKAITELKKLETQYHYDYDVVDAIKQNIQSFKSSNKSFGRQFYELTRNVVHFHLNPKDVILTTTKTNFKETFSTYDHIKRWRTLFADLHIDLVIDDGSCIIYPHEPCQAFFVDKSKFEIVGSVKNKEYKDVNDITDPSEALGFICYKVETGVAKILPQDLAYIRRNSSELAVPVVKVINNKDKILQLIQQHKEHKDDNI